MIGIYKITNLINQHCYIGQSIDIQRRWNHHKNCQDDRPLYRAFQKYGIENFSFEVLEECNRESLNDREIYWINFYDSYENGYNLTKGGDSPLGLGTKISKIEIKEIYDLLLNSNISQSDIAKRYSVGQDVISTINQGKSRYNPDLNYPLRNNQKQHLCIDCKKPLSDTRSLRCITCAHKLQFVCEHPNRDQLKNLIRNKTFSEIGKMYNVSDNTIRKWCKKVNLPTSSRLIKKYSEEEWKNI